MSYYSAPREDGISYLFALLFVIPAIVMFYMIYGLVMLFVMAGSVAIEKIRGY